MINLISTTSQTCMLSNQLPHLQQIFSFYINLNYLGYAAIYLQDRSFSFSLTISMIKSLKSSVQSYFSQRCIIMGQGKTTRNKMPIDLTNIEVSIMQKDHYLLEEVFYFF